MLTHRTTARRQLRTGLAWRAFSMALSVTLSGCIVGPPVDPGPHYDKPPIIARWLPAEFNVVIDLSRADVGTTFAGVAIHDYDLPDDDFPLRSRFMVTVAGTTLRTTPYQDLERLNTPPGDDARIHYNTTDFEFFPCDFQPIRNSPIVNTNVQLEVFDPIPPDERVEPFEEGHQVIHMWDIRFEGACPEDSL